MKNDTPEKSPDYLDTRKKFGGRRLNNIPVYLFLGVGTLLILMVAYGYQAKVNKSHQKMVAAEKNQAPESANVAMVFGENLPQFGEIRSSKAQQDVSIEKNDSNVLYPLRDREDNTDSNGQEYEEMSLQAQQKRHQDYLAALDASTTITAANTNSPKKSGQDMPVSAASESTQQLLKNEKDDPNNQDKKQAWLNQEPKLQDYLQNTRTAPISPYEVKAGTVIPSTMISGINSSLPGTIIAQVSENIFDTATGQYLLIPQGSRLVGVYDNGVTMGQERVLIAWNRIIYPDASSLDIGMMPGADKGGYAGFKDKVNNHYIKIFGNAMLLSMFSAGIQLSQPQATNGENYSSTQIIAASLGQQMGELGMEMARRGLDIAPTIEIRPGYQFNIMVTKDLVLKPWQGN